MPTERPIFNPETIKEEVAGTDKKIDTLNEALEAVKKAKEGALKDIEADIARVYPNDPGKPKEDEENKKNKEKRENEIKAVEKMLERLEKSYLKAAKGSVAESTAENPGLYEFSDLIDEYFEELQSITGDTTQDAGSVDLTTVDPYKFWGDAVGWYEKNQGTEDFKEGKIEEEGERWKNAIHDFKEENSNKIKEKENFQAWIEAHREDLRRVILRQIDDRKYIIDFTNLSKEFGKSLADNVRDADFIAKNIGLADLFADISQVVTVWKGDALYTGTLNEDFDRKNGLKGGYFYDGKYLDIWHGAIISTNPKDQIYDPDKGEEELPDSMFEAPKAREKAREESSFPTIQQAKGGKIINLVYKPGTDKNDTPNATQKRIIEDSIEPRMRTLDKENTGSFKLDYKYNKVYEPGTIEKKGETTFTLTDKQDTSNINNEIVYTSKEFLNIEILIPFSKTDCYLLRTKTQQDNTKPPTVTVYEFTDLETLKIQLGKEIEIQEKSAKKTLENGDIKVLKLDENCSEKTTKSQIRTAGDRYKEKDAETTALSKVIVYGSLPTEFVPEETKISDSELTQDGVDKLPIDERNEDVKVEKGKNISREDLDILLAKTPKATKLSLRESELYKEALFTIASTLNGTLEELDLSYAGFELSDLKYLESCTKLKKLNLGYTAVTDFEVKNYISNLAGLKTLNLSNTKITDKSLESLAKLGNLGSKEEEGLDLRGTNTSFKATLELKKKLPNRNIEMSERAERELVELLKEKIEELIRKHESKIKEDVKEILGYASDENISIRNTKPDYDKKSITTDVYFENQKITSANLTIKITDENGDVISPEKLYEQLFVSKDLDTKPEIEEANGNKLKHKVTIGERVIYTEKRYEFTDEEKVINEKIEKLKKEKTEKEYIETSYENSNKLASEHLVKFLGEDSYSVSIKEIEANKEKQTIHGKLTYKETIIGQIEIKIDAEKEQTTASVLSDNGAAMNKDIIIKKMNEIDEFKKEEEKERVKKETIKEQTEYRKETIESLDKILGKIDKNLKIDKAETKEATVEQGRKYFDLQVIYFGETIGRILPWADVKFEDQPDADIWVELGTDEDSARIKEGNLQERLIKLKEKALEKKRDKKIEEFKKIIEDANKEIFGGDYVGNRLFLNIKELETIKYSTSLEKPYIKAEIHFEKTDIDPTGMGTSTLTTKHIGYIDDWIISESETEISDKNNETITDGGTIIEKIKKLKEAED